ncbi:MAG: hypothetical protein KH135_05070 [Firmicutes bacterium]|nr:hypothetical protein [Bacillota bacterium]
MKKFNELNENDIIKIENYVLRVIKYNNEKNRYVVRGRKENNEFDTFLSYLVTDEEYEKMDAVTRMYCTPFSKVSEVL